MEYGERSWYARRASAWAIASARSPARAGVRGAPVTVESLMLAASFRSRISRDGQGGKPGPPPRPPRREGGPVVCTPSSARIRQGTPRAQADRVSAALAPVSQPSALGLGCVWKVATTTAPFTTGGVFRSRVPLVPAGARSTDRAPVVVS